MVNIPCTLDCEHQHDGLCTLENAAPASCDNKECPHYDKKIPQKHKPLQDDKSLPRDNETYLFNRIFDSTGNSSDADNLD